MKNMKITKKLAVGFGTVVALLLLVAAVGVLNLNTASKDIDYLATQVLPVTNHTWQMRRDIISIERGLYKSIATTGPADTKAYLDAADADAVSLRSNLEAIRGLYGGDMADLDQLEAAVLAAGEPRKKVTELAMKCTNQDNLAAAEVLNTEYAVEYNKAVELMQKISDGVEARADARTKKANTTSSIAVVLLVLAAALSLIPAIGFAFYIARSISRPLQVCSNRLIALSKGDLQMEVADPVSSDEVGEMMVALKSTVTVLKHIIGDVDYLLGEMADKNFDIATTIESEYIGDFHPILMSMRKINRNISDTIFQINQASDQVASGAEQMAQGAQVMADSATDQAGSVEEIVATFDEISDQIKKTAANSKSAKESMTEAGRELGVGQDKMVRVVGAMDDIKEKSNQINNIIKTIEDIATQTNLLSLNAAIEAARAGEAGKGFAVVAAEIRQLADQSGEAAKNIVELITASMSSVDNGSKIVQETSGAIENVVVREHESNVIVEEIAVAATNESEAVVQIAQGIDQLSATIQTNSSTAEETAAASEELTSQAQMLKELVSQFHLKKS